MNDIPGTCNTYFHKYQWRNILIEKPGFPEFLATRLAAVAQDHQDGVFSLS